MRKGAATLVIYDRAFSKEISMSVYLRFGSCESVCLALNYSNNKKVKIILINRYIMKEEGALSCQLIQIHKN